MKKYFLLLLLPVFAFVACDDDDDGKSLDKFWISYATVDNPDDGYFFYLNLDNGERLWTAASNFYNYRPRTGQRILADYTILNDKPAGSAYDHDVKLNDAYNILTKNIFLVTPATQDSIGHDPLDVKDIWVGGDFINVKFNFRLNDRQHLISMVKDDSKTYDDGRIHLELRHNAHNDGQGYVSSGLAAFNILSVVPAPRQPVRIAVHVTDYAGKESIIDLTYEYGSRPAENRQFDRQYFNEGKETSIE